MIFQGKASRTGENGGARKNRNRCHAAPAGREAVSDEKGPEVYHQPAIQALAGEMRGLESAGGNLRVRWNRPRSAPGTGLPR